MSNKIIDVQYVLNKYKNLIRWEEMITSDSSKKDLKNQTNENTFQMEC